LLKSLKVAVRHLSLSWYEVEECIEMTLRYNRWIKLLERTTRCISRISKEGKACTMTLGIESVELLEWEKDLASYF